VVVNKLLFERDLRDSVNIYILSTMSSSGKTALVTGLLRLAVEKKLRAAPFKAQNMSLNSYPAVNGGEIALAQAMQSYVAGLEPRVEFNPVLIKPMGINKAEYIIMGKPRAQLSYSEYLRGPMRKLALDSIRRSIGALASSFDMVIGEGAGSAYEPNIARWDVANFRPAQLLGARVYVILDIDRGGAFLQGVGLINSLPPRWRRMIHGFIINKFRGDDKLLKPAIDWLERRTGKPVLGVLPHIDGLELWPEDSMDLKPMGNGPLDVAVIVYPGVSNFNDLYPLILEEDVRVRPVRSINELGEPHLIILPGSKNVAASLTWMRDRGIDRGITRLAGSSVILGLCGGFQMLGRILSDPHGLEFGSPGHIHGLGLAGFNVRYGIDKVVALSRARVIRGELEGQVLRGYEIHRGVINYDDADPLLLIFLRNNTSVEEYDGVHVGGGIYGLTLHDSLGNPRFRSFILNEARRRFGLPTRESGGTTMDLLIRNVDKLTQIIKENLDIESMIYG